MKLKDLTVGLEVAFARRVTSTPEYAIVLGTAWTVEHFGAPAVRWMLQGHTRWASDAEVKYRPFDADFGDTAGSATILLAIKHMVRDSKGEVAIEWRGTCANLASIRNTWAAQEKTSAECSKASARQRQEHARQLAENRIRLSAVESCIADRLGDADDVRPTDRVTFVFTSQADASPIVTLRLNVLEQILNIKNIKI